MQCRTRVFKFFRHWKIFYKVIQLYRILSLIFKILEILVIWEYTTMQVVVRKYNISFAGSLQLTYDVLGLHPQVALEVRNSYLFIKPSYIVGLLFENYRRCWSRKTRIFLVDDERDILLTYKTGMEFLVDAFNDPVQALLSFKAGKYALVLLDIKMPRMNGFELHREIQKDRRQGYASLLHSLYTTNL